MKKYTVRILSFVCMIALFSGCGKDLKLSVKASEAEKDQPSTALTRKVELSYHSEDGQEKMRESVAVTGLSQPISVKSDLLKELDWDSKGTFEANAYSGDGLLILRGTAHADPKNSEVVDIILDREATLKTAQVSSGILRKFRFQDSPTLADWVLDAVALRKAKSANQCVEGPAIHLDLGGVLFPKLVIESAIKAPALFYQIEDLSSQRSSFSKMAVAINGAGDASLSFDKTFGNGFLWKGGARFKIHFYSNMEEGCIEFKTRPYLQPIEFASYPAGGGSVRSLRGPEGDQVLPQETIGPVREISITNRNQQNISGTLHVELKSPARFNSGGWILCASWSNDAKSYSGLQCSQRFDEAFTVAPNSTKSFFIFGARPDNKNFAVPLFMNSLFTVGWEAQVFDPFDATKRDILSKKRGIDVIQ